MFYNVRHSDRHCFMLAYAIAAADAAFSAILMLRYFFRC